MSVLLSATLLPTAFAQCPPQPDNRQRQLLEPAAFSLEVKDANAPPVELPAAARRSVHASRKNRLILNTAVIDGDAGPALTRVRTDFGIRPDQGVGLMPGPVVFKVPGAGLVSKVVEQDGRFIVAMASDVNVNGTVHQGVFLARFERDGALDASFGQGGSTRVNLFARGRLGNNRPVSMALAPSGKIVVARTINDLFPGNLPGHRVAVVRFSADGVLDGTFGTGGLVHTTIDNSFTASAVAVQRNERVIVAGTSGHLGQCPCFRRATLIRYQANGQPDPSFGSEGVAQTVLFLGGFPPVVSKESSFSDLFVQESGLIVAVGQIQQGTNPLISPTKVLVTEYLPTGDLNPTFGQGGAVTLNFEGEYQRFAASSVVVRENGRVLVGGTASRYGGSPTEAILNDQAFVLAQLRQSGELDDTFGSGGKIVIDVTPRSATSVLPLDDLNKVVLAPSGDVYAAGMAIGPLGSSSTGIILAGLRGDGSLRPDFGTAGIYSSNTTSPLRMWVAQDALLTAEGRLVVSGTHWPDLENPDAIVLWAYSTAPKVGQACP